MKNNFRTWLLAVAVAFIAVTGVRAEEVRKVEPINSQWRFHQGDVAGGESASLDDTAWRLLDVPHDWSIEGRYDQDNPTARGGGYLPAGIGWYRKTLSIPEEYRDRRIFIEFDGIMANSDVWVNGNHLGHRPYGYVGIMYDLTDYLDFGGENVIAVRADNSVQPASRWYTGAGIYRKVRLVTVAQTYLDHWGVFITTPEITTSRAKVVARSEVVNTGAPSKKYRVMTEVTAPDGRVFTSRKARVVFGPDGTAVVENTVEIPAPQLWDTDDPNLYTARTVLLSGKNEVDNQVNPFGIRECRFEAATGFWLNGRNIKLKGVCLHNDGGAVGSAVPATVWERRLRQLKEVGCNAIRVGHSPLGRDFLDVCDRLGFLVMDETFDTWTAAKNHAPYGYNLFFDDWWATDTRDIVRQDRNHPSVFIYSVGNEIRDDLDSPEGQQRFIGQRDLIRSLDPTRPVTLALFRPNSMNVYTNGFAEMMDVVGQNYRVEELVQAWHDRPERKVLGTENIKDTATWLDLRDNPFMAGQFLWTGFDYFGEADWPRIASSAGLFDRTGGWKPAAWQRRSWWTDEPMVKIVRSSGNDGEGNPVADWTPEKFDTYPVARVQVYSNCDEVELYFRNISFGAKEVPQDGSPCQWEIDFEPGPLRAVGRRGGEAVAEDVICTAGEPAKVVLSADKGVVETEWDDVVFVTAAIYDDTDVSGAPGLLCPSARNTVRFSIDGPGEIIAVDNGDVFNHEPYLSNSISAYGGRAVAIVRATGRGLIRVSATVDGLSSGTPVNIHAHTIYR
ncbi:MAG: DUF4982 domain-containing protein [Alistipes sp.]|nr:DUF4982 domain-containing protein [Alistipes sp.]